MNEEAPQPVTPPASAAPEPQPPAAAPVQGGLVLTGERDERKIPAGGNTIWNLQLKNESGGKRKVKVRLTVDVISPLEGPADWGVHLYDATTLIWDSASASASEVTFNMEGSRPKILKLEMEAPKGVRYGEGGHTKLDISFDDGSSPQTIEFKAMARQSIVALKASIGHERNVADDVGSKAKSKNSGIYAILAPANLHGYVLIEGMNTDELRESVRGIRRARGLVDGETSFADIDHFLTPKPLVSGIQEGDVVELIAGPFKGEKARVKNIDEAKEEITVELFEAMVPIPVTVRGDHVRVLEKEK
ncbi:MAG TPA: transcription elongation factor Spt5 [Methanomassiliicoccales archaeon]|nr:transcription elongation factor Spt5 [Methanomassiliicoccales archaeon]